MDKSGVKHDASKPDWTLMPLSALEGVVRVMEFGAKKYTRDGWRTVPNGYQRYIAAAFRHLVAMQTQALDAESGLPHIDHALCSLMFARGMSNQPIEGE